MSLLCSEALVPITRPFIVEKYFMCDEKALIFLCFDADVKYKSSSVCSVLLLDLQPAQEQQTGTKCHGNTVAFDALSPVQ